MTANESITDAAVSGVPAEAALARVLAEHGYEWSDGLEMLLCDCGWAMDAYIEYEDGLAERHGEKAGHDGREIAVVIRHRAHVAEVVTAALREQIAAEVLGPVRAYARGMSERNPSLAEGLSDLADRLSAPVQAAEPEAVDVAADGNCPTCGHWVGAHSGGRGCRTLSCRCPNRLVVQAAEEVDGDGN